MINTINKRKTAKWFFMIDHRALGKCIVLCKERNGKYGLWGGKIEKNETPRAALKREAYEEMGKNITIQRMKHLTQIETATQIHEVFAMKIAGEGKVGKWEITWVAFFPLEKKYTKERLAILSNAENHAQRALEEFMYNHDRNSYENSDIKFVLENSSYKNVFDAFKEELDELMKNINI